MQDTVTASVDAVTNIAGMDIKISNDHLQKI
jgi:hypothetical protein